MKKTAKARVLGPYKQGELWRIVIVDAAGRRRTRSAPTKKEAQRLARREEKRVSAATVGHVMAEWVSERVKAGRALEATVNGQRQRVLALLGQAVGLPIGEVTVIKAKRLYEAHMAHRSTATGQAPAVATQNLWNDRDL